MSDYACKWRKGNFGAVFGSMCGIVILRIVGVEFPAGYFYVSLPFRRDIVFIPLCAGKSAVAFSHVVSVFFLAFMFTQKVLLNLIVPGLFVLYWLLKGNIGGRDFLQACILPVLLLPYFPHIYIIMMLFRCIGMQIFRLMPVFRISLSITG